MMILFPGIVLSAFALPIVLARAPVSMTPGPNTTTTTTTTLAPDQLGNIVIEDDVTADTVVSRQRN